MSVSVVEKPSVPHQVTGRNFILPSPSKVNSHPENWKIQGYLEKVDIGLPGKWNANSHGARPVHQLISITDQEVVNKEVSISNDLVEVGEGADDGRQLGQAVRREVQLRQVLEAPDVRVHLKGHGLVKAVVKDNN